MGGLHSILPPVQTRGVSPILKVDLTEGDEDGRRLNKKGLTVSRRITGSIQWAVSQGRPKHMGNVRVLPAALSAPTLAGLPQAVSVVRQITHVRDATVTMRPSSLQEMVLVGVGDSGFG